MPSLSHGACFGAGEGVLLWIRSREPGEPLETEWRWVPSPVSKSFVPWDSCLICSGNCMCTVWPMNSLTARPLPTLYIPAQAAVTLSVRFYYCRCFHACLHSCHRWSGGFFDCVLFVCLSVCSDVWVLLPLYNCLFYLSPKQLVLFRS